MTDFTGTGISSRAVLVRFVATTWAARKLDKKATKTANDTHNATSKAGRYSKHLLADAEAHGAVVNAIGNARTVFYRNTLPWGNDNWRILPTANFTVFSEAIRVGQSGIETALNDFITRYPALRELARVQLGDLYNENDYPETSDVRSRFTWSIEYDAVKASGDIRVDLPTDQVEQIEAAVTARVEAAAKVALGDAWDQLREAVERIQKAARTSAAGERSGTVRDSLIDNLNEVTDRLTRLNVAQDENLTEAIARAKHELGGIAVEDLRKDERVRTDTEKRAEAILASLQGLYAPAA